MSRLKLGPVAAVKLIIISMCPFIIGIAIFLFLGCPQINMAGQSDPNHGRYFVVFCCFSVSKTCRLSGIIYTRSDHITIINNSSDDPFAAKL